MEDDAIGLKLLEVFECLPLLDRVTFSGSVFGFHWLFSLLFERLAELVAFKTR